MWGGELGNGRSLGDAQSDFFPQDLVSVHWSSSVTGFLKGKSEWNEVSILDGMELFQEGRGQRSQSEG